MTKSELLAHLDAVFQEQKAYIEISSNPEIIARYQGYVDAIEDVTKEIKQLNEEPAAQQELVNNQKLLALQDADDNIDLSSLTAEQLKWYESIVSNGNLDVTREQRNRGL